MMQQYLEVKENYDGYILMYRLGDFYECFYEDAIIASRELEITLTSRDCGDGKRAAMCGVPFHKADLYIGRLVELGFKVAVCEQTEDPKAAVGIVKREVVRVVTPGTVTDGAILSDGNNNFLLSVCFGKNGVALGFADISTGEVSATFVTGEDALSSLENEIAAYQPREAIINISESECKEFCSFIKEKFSTLINDSAKRLFDYERNRDLVKRVFHEEADKLSEPEMLMAVGALLGYIKETQMTDVAFVKEINVYTKGQYLDIDINTRRNLELVEAMRTKEKRGSLLWVLDKTETAMGKRLLRSWILKPLLNPVAIGKRQAAVSDFVSEASLRDELGELLSGVLDIERLTARAVYGTANARDLMSICQSIQKLPDIKALILNLQSDYVKDIYSKLDPLFDVRELLSKALVDNPPLTIREGGMIREGFNADVDYYRSIKENGTEIMASIEQREKEATGIKTLKVAYNKVFGYYIEVSKSFINDVPDRYIRKQTLTNCERYITQELKEMESTIFNADEKLVALEYEIFTSLRNFIADNCDRIRTSAALVAELDVFRSLAVVASKNSYVCPEVDFSTDLYIKDGRHPVVEKFVKDTYFVPNDTSLDTNGNRLMIITGPNMAGKSTYMRQVAIITIMAQIGSFVPAREAKIGIVDKVFTRVGASDDLASGQSTFMLEMNEVAMILKNATNRSLIVYDEVGRGTSTFDGMAIARAVVEYTHSKKIGAKTLFATHYHELTDMEERFEGIVNYNIAAKKRGDSIIFLRKIVRGGTDDSYGIEVAKLAGVPNEVVKRAKEILAEIESGSSVSLPKGIKESKADSSFDLFSGIVASKDSEAADRIRSLDINTVTPIEAMNFLFEMKKLLSD
ncbi:MAG: DNA mismatch repair protein MutS [Ruminococcaceae bacterium]|nr:DNA mismatch repair protein MutS [Oscillospiraceae bacterium]